MKRKPWINPLLVEKLTARGMGDLNPVGCTSTFVDHPNVQLRRRNCIELAFVFEHRFAFSYWIKWKQEQLDRQKVVDRDFQAPDLVTWDWHDDVGGACDFVADELELLDQRNENEVGFFCWAGLRAINDGHIAPAVWLNAIGSVYVLQKQMTADECRDQNYQLSNRYGKNVNVKFFSSMKGLHTALLSRPPRTRTIWDVDLDYFVTKTSDGGKGDAKLIPPSRVKEQTSCHNPVVSLILENVQGITIALEPEYTGGLARSLLLYKTWEGTLFTRSVFDDNCQWKLDIAKSY